MKKTLALTSLLIAALIPSCVREDAAYLQYKAEQAAAQNALTAQQQAGQDIITDATNPYAAPVNDTVNLPANLPTAPTVNQYSSLPPLPGGSGPIYNPANTGNIPAPINNTFQNSATHTVVSGDTIWGLSKQYNVSQAAIMQANGFADSTIRIGQQVIIPQP